jgi:hypothetical protein
MSCDVAVLATEQFLAMRATYLHIRLDFLNQYPEAHNSTRPGFGTAILQFRHYQLSRSIIHDRLVGISCS